MRCPPTSWFSFSQLSAVGHDGSDGRTRRAELTELMAACVDVAERRRGQAEEGWPPASEEVSSVHFKSLGDSEQAKLRFEEARLGNG
jgi:hypothetical protein